MNIDNLVNMSNQIGTFFESMPDREQATEGVANHIRMFWAPPMRTALLDHAERHAGSDLRPIVSEALRMHGHLLRP